MFCKNCGKKLLENEKFCSNCGMSISGEFINPQNAVVNSFGPASAGLRLVNYLLDRIFIVILVIIMAFIGALIFEDGALETIIILIFLVGYDLFFEGIWQRTPAKWITKTKVVRTDGSKPDFWHILGRTLARYIPFEPFSFLFGPVGWHDSLSGTMVVPSNYGVEEIKQINPKRSANSKISTPIIILVCVFVFIILMGFLSSVILLALNGAREKSRDAKRLADVRQMASAFELYFNDKGQYPITLNDMVPTYIGVIPTAPTPADGNCTVDQNGYNFMPSSGGQTYSLTFCLGQITGGYQAGMQTLTPQGIGPTSSNNNQIQTTNTPQTNSANLGSQDAIIQADYQEGYKAGYTDGRATNGKVLDSYSPPATTARRPNYNQGYSDGFTQGCSDGNFNCTTAENQLKQYFSNTPSIDNNSVQ